ncbi:hypothetical protein [Bradyrhizobium niftali]|uniref:hypothetical protein n=1 Tax=Bradyrhizobium niftali TaxID=2560055 RepID=UPI0014317C29|nr:hypothetical protein [Bradyrhizobium niftali]
MIAVTNVVAARLENPLSIKGPSTVHGVVFRLFVLGGSAQVRSLSRQAAGLSHMTFGNA